MSAKVEWNKKKSTDKPMGYFIEIQIPRQTRSRLLVLLVCLILRPSEFCVQRDSSHSHPNDKMVKHDFSAKYKQERNKYHFFCGMLCPHIHTLFEVLTHNGDQQFKQQYKYFCRSTTVLSISCTVYSFIKLINTLFIGNTSTFNSLHIAQFNWLRALGAGHGWKRSPTQNTQISLYKQKHMSKLMHSLQSICQLVCMSASILENYTSFFSNFLFV